MSHGNIHWSECITGDVDATKQHYAAVLGWTYDTMPMPGGWDYTIAKKDGSIVAGIMPLSGMEDGSAQSTWMTYLEVDDIDEAITAATASGGTLLRPWFEVPFVGKIAMVAEPGGALAGLIEPSRTEPPAA